MRHVNEGVLLALEDGELPADEAVRVAEHLEECELCREELSLLQDAAFLLRRELDVGDVAAPAVSDTTIQSLRRRAGASTVRRGGGRWGDLRRAAVLVLGFAAAASATIPGSPVNRWIRDLVQPEPAARVAAERETEATAVAPPSAVESDTFADETGVSVLPEGGAVEVVLRDASAELRVKAVLVEQPRAGVFAAGSASSARFSTAPGRIEVTGAAGGELRVELPRAARVATVEVNGRRYISKEGDQLRLTVPADDGAGAEVNFRVQQ
jgi:hypothetical protein